MSESDNNCFPVVDAHLHLWDIECLRYPWLDGIPGLNRPFSLQDYRQACEVIDVEKMVFVQCECVPEEFLKEVQWVTSLANKDDRLGGIVAGASLEQGDSVKPFLDELSENTLVKGVRRLIESEGDIEFCLESGFVKGVQILEDHDFSFDIAANYRHLANIAKLASLCPNVRFVLDHIGKPDIRNQVFDPWRSQIRTLSDLPNVWCKVSGLVMEADHDNWTREDLRPYIDHVIECFGFARVMYGSNWPVSTLAANCSMWVDALKWVVTDCSEAEAKKLFHDNAIGFYGLPG